MDNRFYFGFNTSEERKKRRKAELYSMSEQVSTFFWDKAPQHGLEMREGQQDIGTPMKNRANQSDGIGRILKKLFWLR